MNIVTCLLNHHDIEINKKFQDGLTSLHVASRDINIPAIEALCLHPLVNVK